jgi:beta-lactamase superfamily II metal-dependent hydrolase
MSTSEALVTLEELTADAPKFHTAIHLLDVGEDPYGDAVLCQFGKTTVLIDGGHPGSYKGQGDHDSIPAQLEELLQHGPPFEIDLVIISHAHQDHVGCIPRMVEEGELRPRFALMIDPALGWGRINTDGLDSAETAFPPKVIQLASALREHPRTAGAERTNLVDFLTDAVTLEQRFEKMIKTLKDNGTRVVRFGRDNTDEITSAFKNVGFTILGPSKAHLRACARLIAKSTQDAMDRVADFFQMDSTIDLESAYLKLMTSSRDELDAPSRLGAAVNLQSIVTMFKYRELKHLFAGDMQFEDPEVSDQSIHDSVLELRQTISEQAPFASVKLSHHGSHNAFSAEILEELGGTALFGICAGKKSTSHPSRATLSVLKENRDDITWVRTDHNRRSSFFFRPGGAEVDVSIGKENDFRPNSSDEGALPPSVQPQKPVLPAVPPQGTPGIKVVSGDDVVELILRIPHTSTRVTFQGEFSVKIEPDANQSNAVMSTPEQKGPDKSRQPLGESGKRLSDLLVVTNRKRLVDNIGEGECERVLDDIRAAGAILFDEVPGGIDEAAQSVKGMTRSDPRVKGVVLLGGYDLIPSQRFDCLPPDVRARVDAREDPDNFVVWSDDVYGKQADDELPLIPVSRIPDGHSGPMVSAALGASRSLFKSRGGVRNSARPFADQIWATLGGSEDLLISEPTIPNHIRQEHFRVDQIYLMLHGHHNDTTRFWGEAGGDYIEAFNVANIPAMNGSVIFTGCCWGALTVNKIASHYSPEQPIAQKTPDSSIAMRFLANGANAFVGCTGAHYSPDEEPYDFFGGPMHAAFWSKISAGESPAQALLSAKTAYAVAMPHGQRGMGARAIEYKILWQYTCLGLGW